MKQKVTLYSSLLLLICASYFSFSQTINDSLFSVFSNKTLPDTVRLKAIHDITWSYVFNNPDTALILVQKELQLAKDKKSKKFEASALIIMGAAFKNKSDFPKALDYMFQSLKIQEQINYKRGMGNCYGAIGAIYADLSDYNKALTYFLKGLKINKEIGRKETISASLDNIGNIYSMLFNYPKSIEYHLQGFKIREEMGDKSGMATSLNNIGAVYTKLGDYPKALEYGLKSLKIHEEIGNKLGISRSLGNIGDAYLKLKQYKSAILYSNKALKLAIETDNLDLQKTIHYHLYEEYKGLGNYSQSLKNYEVAVLLQDSIFKEENQKQIIEKEMKYEYEKKEAVAKVEQDKINVLAREEIQKQKIILTSVVAGLLMVVAFAAYVFRSLKTTSKQKDMIEEKQKEILDSIHYAKRIQTALLPTESYVNKTLNNLIKQS